MKLASSHLHDMSVVVVMVITVNDTLSLVCCCLRARPLTQVMLAATSGM